MQTSAHKEKRPLRFPLSSGIGNECRHNASLPSGLADGQSELFPQSGAYRCIANEAQRIAQNLGLSTANSLLKSADRNPP
jgi:hypothetical protein